MQYMTKWFTLPPISGWNRSIEDFNYEDVEMAGLFYRVMNTTYFNGISVSINI